ncbi:MAG: hypothetical protein ACK4RK_13430 [Gemmataceae bacterium]
MAAIQLESVVLRGVFVVGDETTDWKPCDSGRANLRTGAQNLDRRPLSVGNSQPQHAGHLPYARVYASARIEREPVVLGNCGQARPDNSVRRSAARLARRNIRSMMPCAAVLADRTSTPSQRLSAWRKVEGHCRIGPKAFSLVAGQTLLGSQLSGCPEETVLAQPHADRRVLAGEMPGASTCGMLG